MSAWTANKIINLAAKDATVLGTGQTLSAEETTDLLDTLNAMLAQWRRKRWIIWCLDTTIVNSTGQEDYTIGPQADFNVAARPDKIESAFVRQINNAGLPVDYPLEIIESRNDYNNIATKTMVSFPSYYFYQSSFPLGIIKFWPIPQAAIYAMGVSTKAVLSQFANLTQVLDLSDDYAAAMRYNLAIRAAPMFGYTASEDVKGFARDAMNVIRQSNFQIGRLQMPGDLRRRGIYNIYSDQIR